METALRARRPERPGSAGLPAWHPVQAGSTWRWPVPRPTAPAAALPIAAAGW